MMSQDDNGSLFLRLEKLNAIGIALSSERDINRLLEIILIAAKDITHADGGTLYRMTEDAQELRFEIVRTDSLHIAFGGTTGNPIPFPSLPTHNEQGEPNNSMVAVYAAINEKTVNIVDAYIEAGFDFSGPRKFDHNTGYRSQSFLTVPMKNHENTVIGVLQLINSIDQKTGQVVPFSAADQRLAESLASQAAIALPDVLLDPRDAFFYIDNVRRKCRRRTKAVVDRHTHPAALRHVVHQWLALLLLLTDNPGATVYL